MSFISDPRGEQTTSWRDRARRAGVRWTRADECLDWFEERFGEKGMLLFLVLLCAVAILILLSPIYFLVRSYDVGGYWAPGERTKLEQRLQQIEKRLERCER